MEDWHSNNIFGTFLKEKVIYRRTQGDVDILSDKKYTEAIKGRVQLKKKNPERFSGWVGMENSIFQI